jgi:hypothetical protein
MARWPSMDVEESTSLSLEVSISVGASEEHILAVESDGPDQSLDRVSPSSRKG